MRKGLILSGVAVAAVLLATSVLAENRGVSFTGIGFIDDPGPRPASNVMSMNPQGTVFLVTPNPSGGYAVMWTREGGWGQHVGSMSSTPRMSSNGTIMASGLYPGGNYGWPATWTGTLEGWDPIPSDPGYSPCGSSRMSFYDQGGNGDYAVGLTWQGCSFAQGFLWEKTTNSTVGLGTPNGKATRANAVTADGSEVIGWGTMVQGLRRAGKWDDGQFSWLSDPTGEEPKVCVQSGGFCNSNSASTTSGCPEFVDDGNCTNRGTCQNRGACVSNVCVGGINAGGSCTSSFQCPGACVDGTNPGASCTSDSSCAGTCTGPNAGATCTSNGACPDTPVCVNNPDWNDDLFKGEAYDVTDDGKYAVGRNYNYSDKWTSGYRMNPDGSFTEIPPPETFQDLVDPFRVSQDGKTMVGRVGNPFFGSIPFFWNEGMGTVDLQLFLVQQGLDELFFWYLTDVYDVSADGTVIAGRGFNPDGWLEGFIVDMKKVWVCHTPPGNPENARTLGVAFQNVGEHMAHGDFLGTCEFMNSGGLSRSAALRDRLNSSPSAAMSNVYPGSGWDLTPASWNGAPDAKPQPERPRLQETRDRISNKTRAND